MRSALNQPTAPAGWYDDASDLTILRYWDGTQWTEHTAPKAAPVPAPAAPPVLPPATQALTSPTTPTPDWDPSLYSTTGGATVARQGLSRKAIVWIVIGAVVAFIILVSSIANAAGGGSQDREPVAAVSTAPTPTPIATASEEPEPAPALAPTEEVAAEPSTAPVPDATYFKTTANGHLDDYTKDLDDMVVTLDENGFFRLLTNEIELAFNVGQLQSLEVPAAVQAEWAAQLAGLDAATTKISDDVSDEQYDTLRADLEAARGVANVMHDIANRSAP